MSLQSLDKSTSISDILMAGVSEEHLFVFYSDLTSVSYTFSISSSNQVSLA